MSQAQAAAAARRPRWLVYLQLGRVSNLPTVWTNALAGLLLAGALPDAPRMAFLLVAVSLFYVAGMFLNDAFDFRFDREVRPERPIPAGDVSQREVYTLGFGMMALALVLLAVPASWQPGYPLVAVLLAALALGVLITYYNYRHKADPLSPVVMALCRAMVYVIAGGVAATGSWVGVLGGASILATYLIGLTYVAKQENLRQVTNLWPLMFLLAPFVYGAPVWVELDWRVLIYAGFLAWVAYAVSFLLRREGRSIPRAVVSLIAGISLLDALLIAGNTPEPLWALAALAGFALTLFFQRYIAGT